MPCLKWADPKVTGIKLFKWNERLLANAIPKGQALFVLRRAHDGYIKRIMRFSLINLLTREPNSSSPNFVTRSDGLTFTGLINQSGLFLLHPGQDHMVEDLTSFFQTSFEFSGFTVHSPKSPRLVIVLDFSYTPYMHLHCPGTRKWLTDMRCMYPHSNRDESGVELPNYEVEIAICKYATNPEERAKVEANSGASGYVPRNDVEAAYSEEMIDIVKYLRKCKHTRKASPLFPLSDEHPLGLVAVEKPSVKLLTETTPLDDCPICLAAMKKEDVALTTKCGHVFHRECAIKWLRKNLTCPCCRSSTILVL